MNGRFGAALLLVLAASAPGAGGVRQSAPPATLSWEPSIGPFAGVVNAFAEAESGTLFAWVQGDFFRSRDDGAHWTRCESQPGVLSSGKPWMFTVRGRLYAIRNPGRAMYVSDDECTSSREVAAPGGSVGFPETVSSVDGMLFAVYRGYGLFRSEDEGRTWTRLDAPTNIQSPVIAADGQLHLIASGRHYGSGDKGTTWAVLGDDHFTTAADFDRFVAGLEWLMRTSDGGYTWVSARQPPFTLAARRTSVNIVTDGIDRSSDGGATRTRIPRPVDPRYGPWALHETHAGTLLAGTGLGIFRWSAAESRWTQTGVATYGLRALAAHRGVAYASFERTIERSDDSGVTWSRVEPVFSGTLRPLVWPSSFRRLFPAEDGTLRASTDRELLSSKDGGRTWTSTGLDHGVYDLLHDAGIWYAATSQGVFRSADAATWGECSNGLAGGDTRAIVVTSRGDLIVQSGGQLYRSTDRCDSWAPLATHRSLSASHLANPKPWPLLVGDQRAGVFLLGNGVSQLLVAQRTWVTHAADPLITDVARDSEGRFWLGSTAGVFRLDTEGAEWHLVEAGLPGRIRAIAVDPAGYLLAAVADRGIFRARLP